LTRKIEIELRPKGTLKRVDVIRNLHRDMGLSSTESAQLVGRVFDHIATALERGEDVKLAGFGTFKLRQKASRLGRNPKTGEECVIAPRKVVTFKPSVAMRERVEVASVSGQSQPEIVKEDRVIPKYKAPPSQLCKTSFGAGRSRPKIKRQEWISLFELLGSFAISNAGFRGKKAEIFVQSVLEIKTLLDPGAAVTRKSLISWLTLNQNKCKDWSKDGTLVPRFKANLSRLRSMSHKSDIVFAMVNIAIAENDFSDSQKTLIAHAILGWDMPANIILDLKYVCPEIIPHLEDHL
jgi:integration host factor subunit alpha